MVSFLLVVCVLNLFGSKVSENQWTFSIPVVTLSEGAKRLAN